MAGCTDGSGQASEESALERQRLQLEQERLRLEQERLKAEQERIAREREVARLDHIVSRYTAQAGRQLMDAIGGGQDLISRYGKWRFDPTTRQFTIPMEVTFHGSFVRSNEYYVQGILTILEDGTEPRFARSETNENYGLAEDRMFTLKLVGGGIIALAAMSSDK